MSTIIGNLSIESEVNESECEKKKRALEFAQKEVDELLKRGDIKQPKKKTDRELGINTVSGGRYIRAFTKLSNLDFFEKAVLLNLASRLDFRGLDENGFFQDEVRFVTQEQLAEDLSLSERKIRDVLSSLSKKKFIEKKNHYNFEKRCRSVNSYSITEHAFIECFNTLKKHNDAKFHEYLEELERAKQYYIDMYLSSQRIQTIHDQPAQYAGSDFLYKTQPAQYAGWTGTVCREDRHNMPIFSFLIFPLHISSFLMCVDKVQTQIFTHIEKEDSKKAKINIIPSIESKLITKEVLRKTTRGPKKQEENEIPMNMRRKLSDILRDVLNRDFVDNDDCKMIIQIVTSNTNKTIEDFRVMMIELPNYDSSLIFNPNLILRDRKIRRDLNALEVAKNLEQWIVSKETIISEYESSKRVLAELERQKELDALEFLTKEEEERKKREILKLESERLLKEKDQQDFEKLPDEFKEWFQKLSPFNKKEFKKQIRKHGPETFSNKILPTINEYQKHCDKNYKHFNDSQNIVV